MHKTSHFCTEVNSKVLNLQCVNFQPLQMRTKFQMREREKVPVVTGLLNKYHPIVPCLLQITIRILMVSGETEVN